MKLIAHRGNTNGPNKELENNPKVIDSVITKGYDVEIDLRYVDYRFYLGHDEAQHLVSWRWLVDRKENFWIHCKDLESLNIFANSPVDFNYFWHQEDDFTLTSKNYIWTYPGKRHTKKSVIVMPEWNVPTEEIFNYLKALNCYGICSDYVEKLL